MEAFDALEPAELGQQVGQRVAPAHLAVAVGGDHQEGQRLD
jgi:hypothetical protein